MLRDPAPHLLEEADDAAVVLGAVRRRGAGEEELARDPIRRAPGDGEAAGRYVHLALLDVRRLRPGRRREALAVVVAQHAPEDWRGEPAARGAAAQRARLVVTEPDRSDQVGGASHEPDVLRIVGRARLAGE